MEIIDASSLMIPTNESTVSQLIRPMREQDRTWLGGGGAGRGGHRARLAAVLRAGGTGWGLQGGGGTSLASLGLLLVLGPPVLEPDLHLGLAQAQGRGQLSSLRQCEVLGPLEPRLQLLDLGTRVDRPGVSDLGIEIFQNILLLKY